MKPHHLLRPNEELSLKAMFAAHFAIVIWLIEMGRDEEHSLRGVLIFSNAFLFITFFWALHERVCMNPIQLAAIIELVLITVDFKTCFRMYQLDWTLFFPLKFSAWCVSLGLRTITFVLLSKICMDRCCTGDIKTEIELPKILRRESTSKTTDEEGGHSHHTSSHHHKQQKVEIELSKESV